MDVMRLDKFLADAGLGTRSQVKTIIRKGTITVNGVPAKKPEQSVNPETDQICDGSRELTAVKTVYYMLNKPAGYVSSTEEHDGPSVLSLLKDEAGQSVPGKGLFPAGRLDKDTEGLLLITNDGALAHDLLSPRKHVEKTYFARVKGPMTEAVAEAFDRGLDIGEKRPTLPAKLIIVESGAEVSQVTVTIREGKFHQIKRMFEKVGSEVLYLKRISFGSLTLDETLAPGTFRPLTEEEIRQLQAGDQTA
ncbi:rRNA pseudouridine synthase [Oscillospiraceae bacterium Marseille-Q3528]|nr:rRNA pseudouridine synthase [Oscillospiraceae bacterium Marseille-Q3528]